MLKLSIMSISNILKKLNSRDTQLFPRFPKINKKIKFVSIFVAFIFLGFVGHQIFAVGFNLDTITQIKNKQSAMTKGNNQESWMNEAFSSNGMVLIQAIGGSIPDSTLEGKTSYVPSGLLGVTNQAIASLYNPPASGVKYIAQSFNSFLGKPAYADNGYQGLMGIMPIWKSFRNVIYSLFSLIFVFTGIAIMLRIKISPQAVITIQSAIPKLITSLILVTFSYAIAGLLIDFSYLLLALTLNVINIDNLINVPREITSPSTFGLLFSLIPEQAWMIIGSFPTAIATILGADAALTHALAIFSLITGDIAGFILGFLILLIFVLVYTIKLLFGLAKCYINLILRIIIGPLEIAIGAIPNMKMGFSSWIINIIANLAVFPIVIIFVSLIKIINQNLNNNLWTPPGLTVLGNIVPTLIGLSSLMLVSKLPKLIPEFIFQIKPSPFGKAIGEGFKELPGRDLVGVGVSGVRSGVSGAIETRVGNTKLGQWVTGGKPPVGGPSNTTEQTTTKSEVGV